MAASERGNEKIIFSRSLGTGKATQSFSSSGKVRGDFKYRFINSGCNYSALEKSGKLKHSIDMKKHPDLTALTETEKDALIIALYGVIDEL
ncbi:MAG: hypothetical protein QX203_00940, partial [Methylococcaceae bacterium]